VRREGQLTSLPPDRHPDQTALEDYTPVWLHYTSCLRPVHVLRYPRGACAGELRHGNIVRFMECLFEGLPLHCMEPRGERHLWELLETLQVS
jgi:hypothetical protein